MTLILSGTDGLSDVDGTAATPAIRGTDANTGIFFPAADTIAFSEGGTEAMRIDSSGNVGIGMTSPAAPLHVFTTGSEQARFVRDLATDAGISVQADNSGAILDTIGVHNLRFFTGATERVRIDSSGNLLVGTTSQPVSTYRQVIQYSGNGGQGGIMFNDTDGGQTLEACYFRKDGGQRGYIRVTTSGTTYATVSDYRLKTDVAPMIGALAKVMALNPCTYTWKETNKNGQGFIAHELAKVVPDCVTGEKDAVETYTDEEGNEQTRPKYQGIDTSFLVATLTAAIQEQQAIIQSLTARIEALEGK